MSRILEPIHQWKEGICSESHSKEDLGNIKDMHRLPIFQGYCFREIPGRVDAPSTMGLIRRGIPRDMVLAQELMKSLAGVNPEGPTTPLKPWRSSISSRSDAFLQINDRINNVIICFEAFKKGDYSISAILAELNQTEDFITRSKRLATAPTWVDNARVYPTRGNVARLFRGQQRSTSPPSSGSSLRMGSLGLGMKRSPTTGMAAVQTVFMSTPWSRTQPISMPPTQQGKDTFADLVELF
ncbi:hypothetical protein BD769DRAFT_1642130 [Suillus cothurnatus]|nr:hypothetical protein BD769DRAFT_1642130 [Suillus cothurnatus]